MSETHLSYLFTQAMTPVYKWSIIEYLHVLWNWEKCKSELSIQYVNSQRIDFGKFNIFKNF